MDALMSSINICAAYVYMWASVQVLCSNQGYFELLMSLLYVIVTVKDRWFLN